MAREADGGHWPVEIDEVDTAFDRPEELGRHVADLGKQPAGRFAILLDRGPVDGWRRFLGRKRDVSPFLAIEWHGPYPSLIFHDDAWSKYRALDRTHPVPATEEERRHIAHGEPVGPPPEECMDKGRAFQAIAESLETQVRPPWLDYRYVP
jgi:hypothetical protein